MRLLFLIVCISIAVFVAYFGEPYVIDNQPAISALTTIFTVFAGFLVAIVTVLGDPSLIPAGTWRTAEARRDAIESRLIIHVWLFTFYLIAIGLLFTGIVVSDVPNETVSLNAKVWITRAYLFFGTLAFLLTFALPRSLLHLQRARVDAEIERRRAAVGLENESREKDGDATR